MKNRHSNALQADNRPSDGDRLLFINPYELFSRIIPLIRIPFPFTFFWGKKDDCGTS